MTKHSSPPVFARFSVIPILIVVLFFVTRSYDHTLNLLIIIGSPLAGILVVCIGRNIIDKNPTVNHTIKVTHIVHFVLINLIVAAVAKAIQVGQYWPGWLIPLPVQIGQALTFVTGIVTLLSVVNLAADSRGAPGSLIKLTQKVAVSKMYAWTRNPMVLSFFSCLISIGLWLRSSLFILWVVVLFIPFITTFLKVFEERELEIRFGSSYLEYKAKTPMLWPKKPKT